jgi:cilia- and flagella-associated protein 53
MASQGQKIIEAKKAQESAAREMRMAIEADDRIKRIADFEIQTTKKIESKQAKKRFDELKGQRNASVIERRRLLADIYNSEMEMWREEVMNKVESVEERKARIMERAYALRDARESKRQSYLQECYDRQWKDACDDARTLDSIAMNKWVGKERKDHIQRNIEQRGSDKAAEDEWVAAWKQQIANAGGKEDAKDAYRQAQAAATADGLMNQMRYNYERKMVFLENKAKEDEAEIADCRAAIAEEDAKQAKRLEDAVRKGKDTMIYNESNKGNIAEKIQQEKEQDAILLAYALRKEAEAKAEEKGKKDAAAQAAKGFKKYLEMQMIKDAEDGGEIDRMRDAEAQKVWKAREEALKARDDARAYLMKMVKEGREDQIRRKAESVRKEKEDEAEYAKGFILDAQEGIRQESEAGYGRRVAAEANQKLLNDQISHRQMLLEKEKQDQYLQDKQMERVERIHREKLAQQAGTLRLKFPKRAPNFGN